MMQNTFKVRRNYFRWYLKRSVCVAIPFLYFERYRLFCAKKICVRPLGDKVKSAWRFIWRRISFKIRCVAEAAKSLLSPFEAFSSQKKLKPRGWIWMQRCKNTLLFWKSKNENESCFLSWFRMTKHRTRSHCFYVSGQNKTLSLVS